MPVDASTETMPAAIGACCPSGTGPINAAQAEELARIFKALGDPTRVTLYALIATSAAGEMCACDLTGPVGLSQPTVSHHMRLLVEAGLVEREQRGRWAYYRPTPSPLLTAAAMLTQLPTMR